MEQRSTTRIKCAMVTYELERELGRYVREHSTQISKSNTAQEILKRNPDEKPSPEELARVIVENSYLGEVLSLAMAAAKGTSDLEHLTSLEKISLALGLFDIRNAISHPNRPFPECYWYRCAAIAADPAIDALSFFDVSLAFQNAQDGKLEEPPETWMRKKRWSVPTTIPTEFEHSVTGLVGRTSDANRLKKEITNPRAPLIALIAKGGVGKTSLLLQVLSDFCLSTESGQYIDCVLWESLKQEKLTTTGIELLNSPDSLAQLEESLRRTASDLFGEDFETFEVLKKSLADKRLLLCIDNLETLLRDSPDDFEAFYENLPDAWKVVVTSRIPVDGAKNLALDVLDKNGAISLARSYLQSKSANTSDEPLLERISVGCKFNPLAIRLTIESYIAGAEIKDALAKSEQDVLAFSFKNLIDKLSVLENSILEAMFVLEQPSRSEICGALSATVDEVSQAIARLTKMSLMVRRDSDSGETYTLGGSIRDLLRANPQGTAIRSSIAAWVAKNRSTAEHTQRLQLEQHVSPIDLGYVPQNAEAVIISLSRRLKAAIKREDRGAIVQIEAEIRHELTCGASSSFIHRVYGWAAMELDDDVTSITHFKRAAAIDTEDPAPLFGLCLIYQAQSNNQELYNVSKQLIENGWGEPATNHGNYYASRVWAIHLLSANIAEKFSEIFAHTINWEDQLSTLPALALGRASAYRRQADLEYRKTHCGPDRVGSFLAKAAKILMKILISEGFAQWFLPELRKLFGSLSHYENKGVPLAQFSTDDKETVIILLRYCLSSGAVVAGISAGEVVPLKALLNGSQTSATDVVLTSRRDRFVKDGYRIARIKPGMRAEANYLFAQDDKGIDYYVPHSAIDNGNWSRRQLLTTGRELAIKTTPTEPGKALRCVEAWIVD